MRCARRTAEAIAQHLPQIVHVHNTWPLLSPSVYGACRRAGVPVVQTLHNFRLACPQAMFLRDGRVCTDCLGRTPWRAVKHACYRGSRAQTAVLAATSLGSTSFHYLGNAKALDDYHELGLLPIAGLLGNATLAGWITRDKAATTQPFPGASGNAVATGLGAWSDAFNAMPAVLLLRP